MASQSALSTCMHMRQKLSLTKSALSCLQLKNDTLRSEWRRARPLLMRELAKLAEVKRVAEEINSAEKRRKVSRIFTSKNGEQHEIITHKNGGTQAWPCLSPRVSTRLYPARAFSYARAQMKVGSLHHGNP